MNDDVPNACGIFLIPHGYGQYTLRPFNHLDRSVSAEEWERYDALVEGIAYMLSEGSLFLTTLGETIKAQQENEIEFEADEDLLDAIAEAKVVPFKN